MVVYNSTLNEESARGTAFPLGAVVGFVGAAILDNCPSLRDSLNTRCGFNGYLENRMQHVERRHSWS